MFVKELVFFVFDYSAAKIRFIYGCSALLKSRNMRRIMSATSFGDLTMSVFSVECRGFSDLQHHQPLTSPFSFPVLGRCSGRADSAAGETILRAETDEFSARRRQDDKSSRSMGGTRSHTHQPTEADPSVCIAETAVDQPVVKGIVA